MKKLVSVALVALCACSMAFSFDLFGLKVSAGLGVLGGPEFDTAILGVKPSITATSGTVFNIGAQLYADATYVRLGIGYNALIADTASRKGQNDYIILSLTGQYPIDLRPVVLNPSIGLEYDICVGSTMSFSGLPPLVTTDNSLHNRLFAKVGFSVDYFVTENIYIRPEIFACFLVQSNLNDKLKDLNARFDELKIDIGFLAGYRF